MHLSRNQELKKHRKMFTGFESLRIRLETWRTTNFVCFESDLDTSKSCKCFFKQRVFSWCSITPISLSLNTVIFHSLIETKAMQILTKRTPYFAVRSYQFYTTCIDFLRPHQGCKQIKMYGKRFKNHTKELLMESVLNKLHNVLFFLLTWKIPGDFH